MASQKNNVLSGMVGNVIFYEFRGVQCIRVRPARVKQSKATKISAGQFGQASRISRLLRSGFHELLADTKEKNMMYRLNKVLLQWLRNGNPANSAQGFSFIDQFQFNEKTSLAEKLKLPLTLDWEQPGKIIVNIPKLLPSRDIAAPAGTGTVQWQIAAVSCTIADRSELAGYSVRTIDITYNDNLVPANKIELPIVLKAGHLTVVSLALKYKVVKNGNSILVNDARWLPVGIIGTKF
jgi:hypothetical protein